MFMCGMTRCCWISSISVVRQRICHKSRPFHHDGRKEGNVLFNDALNTFYLRLYGVGHMVKDHQIAREETRCRHMGYSFRLAARVLLYASSHRQDNTYHGLCDTSRGAPAGTSNSSMGPPHEGSIRRPIALPDDTMTTKVVDRRAVRGMTFPTTSKHWRRKRGGGGGKGGMCPPIVLTGGQ